MGGLRGRDLRCVGRRANFYRWQIADLQDESESIPNTQEEENTQKKIRSDFEHMPGYQDSPKGNQSGANKVDLLKKIRLAPSKTHFTAGNLIF